MARGEKEGEESFRTLKTYLASGRYFDTLGLADIKAYFTMVVAHLVAYRERVGDSGDIEKV